MSDIEVTLKEMMLVDGALGAAIVDYTSGMALGVAGGGRGLDLEVAAAGNTEVVRAKMRTIDQLGLGEQIEDILITLASQYHIIRPLTGVKTGGLFLYIALDRTRANLAMARHLLRGIADAIEI